MASGSSKKKQAPCLTLDDLLRLLAEEKNGKPNYGAILQYFRLQAGWTAERLALLYSEVRGLDEKEAVTPHWIYMMENKNMVPTDPKRRWILARLLDIPPVLFGLEPLNRAMSDLFKWERVDVQEYRLTLENYCRGWHAGSVFQAVNDIKTRISNLYREASHASEKKEMLELLCRYRVFLGGLAFDHMYFEAAIDSLSKAILIAEQEHFYDILAFALRQRSGIYIERGEITTLLYDYTTAKPDFTNALLDDQAAQQYIAKVQPMIRGLIVGQSGIISAYTAQDKKDFKKALNIIDQGKQYIGVRQDEPSITIVSTLDEERYHVDRADAYLAYPSWNLDHARAAQEELEKAAKKAIHSLYRKAFGATLLARSYLVGGEYQMAVAYAEDALSTVQISGSTINLARLDAIYHYLKKIPYGKSSDVALLGMKLLKVQKPEVFH